MGKEFWEIAEPFTKQTAREITYGPQYPVFLAVMLKIGFQVERKDCVSCVSDGQKALRRLYKKDFGSMKSKEYILKDLAVAFEGVRYEQDTITDAIAKKMLAKHPEFRAFFEKVPEPKPAPKRKKKSSPTS